MPLPRLALLLATPFLLWSGCSATSASQLPACHVAAPISDPTTAAPGDNIRLYMHALSTDWDTIVTIGSVQATVLGVERENCSDCDGCLTPTDSADTAYADCNACTYTCDSCAELCATCVEYVRVTVPDLPDGAWPVSVTNVHGQSETGILTVASQADTATSAP